MTTVVILAAGDGKRLKGLCPEPKPFIPLHNKPMLCHLLDSTPPTIPVVVVLSPKGRRIWQDTMVPRYNHVETIVQETPAGTGDALRKALPACSTERILVINADTPLLDITRILSHSPSRPIAMFVARRRSMMHSGGMGRCILDPMTGSWTIHEAHTLTEPPRDDDYVNTGVYIMDTKAIEQPIRGLPIHENKEYYITDLISALPTEAVYVPDADRFQGINTPEEYACVSSLLER